MKHEDLDIRTLGFLADATKGGRKCTVWTLSTDDGLYFFTKNEGGETLRGPVRKPPKYRRLADLPDDVKIERVTVGYY